MVKITVDRGLCEHHGMCVFAAGDIFTFTDKGEMEYISEVDESRRDIVEDCAEICPMQAITID